MIIEAGISEHGRGHELRLKTPHGDHSPGLLLIRKYYQGGNTVAIDCRIRTLLVQMRYIYVPVKLAPLDYSFRNDATSAHLIRDVQEV